MKVEFERGRNMANEILDKYSDISLTDLVDDTRKGSRDSNLVKQLMNRTGLTASQLGDYLGCTRTYFNGKMSRDAFTIKDLVIIAHACGYSLELVSDKSDDKLPIDTFAYLEFVNDGEAERVREKDRKYKERELLRSEYEAKKKELEDFKKKYGFDD